MSPPLTFEAASVDSCWARGLILGGDHDLSGVDLVLGVRKLLLADDRLELFPEQAVLQPLPEFSLGEIVAIQKLLECGAVGVALQCRHRRWSRRR